MTAFLWIHLYHHQPLISNASIDITLSLPAIPNSIAQVEAAELQRGRRRAENEPLDGEEEVRHILRHALGVPSPEGRKALSGPRVCRVPAGATAKRYITVLANHSTWSSNSAIELAGIIRAQA